jgi:glutamate synthase domain-containing protein 1
VNGLYDPHFAHEAYGVGFVANIKCAKSHDIVAKGLEILVSLAYRGACRCDPETGDGAGNSGSSSRATSSGFRHRSPTHFADMTYGCLQTSRWNLTACKQRWRQGD